MPVRFWNALYPLGWREIRITGDLVVNMYPRRASQRGRFAQDPCERMVIEGYIDGHNIDFIKGRVAFDLEWNSKDQTFDRDLLAMRTYFDCGRGVLELVPLPGKGLPQNLQGVAVAVKLEFLLEILPHICRHSVSPFLWTRMRIFHGSVLPGGI